MRFLDRSSLRDPESMPRFQGGPLSGVRERLVRLSRGQRSGDRLHVAGAPVVTAGPEAGISFELEVEDAMAAMAEFQANGEKADYPLADEPLGQRRLSFHDPSGLWVNVVQQLVPSTS